MFVWDEAHDDDDVEFEGMHGDEMVDSSDEEFDQEEADRQAEQAAFQPFEPDDFSTPGEGYQVLAYSCLPSVTSHRSPVISHQSSIISTIHRLPSTICH